MYISDTSFNLLGVYNMGIKPTVIKFTRKVRPSFRAGFDALNNNEILYDVNSQLYYKLSERGLVSSYGNDTWSVSVDLLHILNNFNGDIYVEVEQQWYDNIPKKGILCKVWDNDNENDHSDIAIIYKYDKTDNQSLRFIANATSSYLHPKYLHARPLTLDEMKEYLYED